MEVKKVYFLEDDYNKNYKMDIYTITDICSRIENNESISKIANDYGIGRANIYKILRGETYGEIASNYDFSNYNNNSTPISTVHEICKLLQNGKYPSEIARELGIGRFVVEKIRNGEKYTDISKEYLFDSKPSMESKLSEYTVRKICLAFQNGKSIKDISVAMNINYSTIQNIYMRRSFASIVKDYTW